MRKRKELDALHKFRLIKNKSNPILEASEDELFLPEKKISITKTRLSRSYYCWNSCQYIFSFSFVCILIIVCVGLNRANIKIKNEIKILSLHLNEVEKKYSYNELNNILLTIEQIKIRLNFLEQTNISLIYNQLNSLQNENEIIQIQKLIIHLEQLNNFVHNSSDNTLIILSKFQSDLEKLQSQIDKCKCLKKSTHLKSLIVGDDQIKKKIITKSNMNNENKQTQNAIDVEQIINQSPITN